MSIHHFLSNFYQHFLSISFRFLLQRFHGLTVTCTRLHIYLLLTFFLHIDRTFLKIFDFDALRFWPWSLTFKSHLGSKISLPFESPYMTSYFTCIDTFSLSRTVFEIFDFKILMVWPWLLTFRDQLRSKIFSPFESPYMTSYLTAIDTFFLSRTVLKIFDFKVFRVWPWPSTYEGHLRSKIFSSFESSYMTSYLTSIDTFYLVTFLRFSTSNVLGFDLDLWHLEVTWVQKTCHHSKAHTWLPI